MPYRTTGHALLAKMREADEMGQMVEFDSRIRWQIKKELKDTKGKILEYKLLGDMQKVKMIDEDICMLKAALALGRFRVL